MDDKRNNELEEEDNTTNASEKSEVHSGYAYDNRFTDDDWKNPLLESPQKHVKSTAVVKYSTVQSLANFAVLQCNTDLNSPPSNWLSSSADSYGLQHVPSHSTGFSSFRMAHMFPECVGEVDVVSDAENIKKLLKIPYSKGPVSMMVHRIENTLLIDEFDIHKYLLRTAESEWEWLKKFFYEHVLESLSGKEKVLPHKNKSRCALQQRSLVSKFLYHSLVETEDKNSCSSETPNNSQTEASVPIPVPLRDPPLPEPNLEEELPDPTSNHQFTRNVVWTFEDIQMLIGSNLPIFGGNTHPCISLKLRDMTKPINVLTGIDYWLDNLMCNVPELVMCYHLDGIVQKYELIKTEDLPHLENSKFSPKVIRDVAQNILSFLKSNATKAGHTYWLFKGKDDDIVKLYDLTSLCSDLMDDKGQNPFTIPVAMLLYRVARNMKHCADSQRQRGTIRLLLKNCIDLLIKEKYPQIVTSAHYMLADLYVPADTDPAAPNMTEQIDDDISSSGYEEEEEVVAAGVEEEVVLDEKEHTSSSVNVKSLCVAMSYPACYKAPPPPLSRDVEQRCFSALEHVAAGLQCLKLFGCDAGKRTESHRANNEDTSSKQSEKPSVPNVAKPFEAIPMPYTPLKGNKAQVKDTVVTPSGCSKVRKKETADHHDSEKKLFPQSLLCMYRAEAMPTWQQPEPSDKRFWCSHLKILLYEKACLVYATLAEDMINKSSYGSALRYIAMVLQLQQLLERFASSSPNVGLQSYLLGRAGDLCFMIVQDWVHVRKHRDLYYCATDIDVEVRRQVGAQAWRCPAKESENNLLDLIPQRITSMEQMLVAGQTCYRKALEIEPFEQQCNNLRRRLGNIENELGVLYMNQAAVSYQETGIKAQQIDKSSLQSLLNKSLVHLESGVQAFEAVRDEANLALLHSNKGRLMRMWAHYHCPDMKNRSHLVGQERHFYNKAHVSYQKALQVLGNRKCNPEIWDTVVWELSTTLFSMATVLQDFPLVGEKSPEEVEREVVEYLMKALKYCDLDTPGARQPIYQFRAATIHHRLASLYHRSYRNLPADDPKRKNVLQLSRLHYEKASKMLIFLEYPTDFLRIQMERVALAEFQAQNSGSFAARHKAFQNALDYFIQCTPMLRIIQEKLQESEVKRHRRRRRKSSNSCGNDVASVTQSVANLGLSEETTGEDREVGDDDGMEMDDMYVILHLLEQRIQFVLLELTKLYHNRGKKELDGMGAVYKNLYSLTLKKNSRKLAEKDLAGCLIDILNQIETVLGQSGQSSKSR